MSLIFILSLITLPTPVSHAAPYLPTGWTITEGDEGIRYTDCSSVAEGNTRLTRLIQELMSHDEKLLRDRNRVIDEILSLETMFTDVIDYHEAALHRAALAKTGLATPRAKAPGSIIVETDLLLEQLSHLVPKDELEMTYDQILLFVRADPESKIRSWFVANDNLIHPLEEEPKVLNDEELEVFSDELEALSANYLGVLSAIRKSALLIDLLKTKNSQSIEIQGFSSAMLKKTKQAAMRVEASFASMLGTYGLQAAFPKVSTEEHLDFVDLILNSFRYKNFGNQDFAHIQADLLTAIENLTQESY
jgi:hypothetical protein